jgi:hypothetical protein
MMVKENLERMMCGTISFQGEILLSGFTGMEQVEEIFL